MTNHVLRAIILAAALACIAGPAALAHDDDGDGVCDDLVTTTVPILPIPDSNPILNYEISDALLVALGSLKESNREAYDAVARELAALPSEKKAALTRDLGLAISSTNVTLSLDTRMMILMNGKTLQNRSSR